LHTLLFDMTRNGVVHSSQSHSGVTTQKQTQILYTVDTSSVGRWHELGILLYMIGTTLLTISADQ
jgi:hypothetical protein